MKKISPLCRNLLTGIAALFPVCSLLAGDTNETVSPASSATTAIAAPEPTPKLPYGVDDVLKLSRAQISDDIVLNYVRNSGTIYNLGPQEIVYLRNQGVSDRVINAMLDQRRTVPAAVPSSAPAAPAIADAPPVPNAASVPVAPDYSQVAPQPAPPQSSVYVIPSTAANAYYYPYYGYYGPSYYSPYYGGYWGPSFSIGFGFGGYGYPHGGYYHGGYYHGGYYGHGGYGHGGGHGHGGYHR